MSKQETELSVRDFMEVAMGTYARGDGHRFRAVTMKPTKKVFLGEQPITVYEPVDDYLDQLWGECFTREQADTYQEAKSVLYDSLMAGDIPMYAGRMNVRVPRPTHQTIDMAFVRLSDFAKWIKSNKPAGRSNWLQLIMDATAPCGEAAVVDDPDHPGQTMTIQCRVPIRPGRPPSTPKQQAYDHYGDVDRQIEVARELQARGAAINPGSMIDEIVRLSEVQFPGSDTSAKTWAKTFVVAPIYKALGLKQKRQSTRLKKTVNVEGSPLARLFQK
ncbi:MAG: hypothetical protein GJU72_14510 [Acidithiobacillus ferriphilus]|jgi:hypothetical protein|uniref:hypothetical protein n=1 Tax=Acidithiobacillus ferriphilus TaxID=1689834 RepID=UPI002431C351|nr:hypothetical protein [Acidithiobacillus ferriphilus]MBW9250233.1 hypothetical protein [Acidithiobacillus ferriphilus]MBW9255341.1 hypothetical protein [Acidithiobacillus ferriphilus]